MVEDEKVAAIMRELRLGGSKRQCEWREGEKGIVREEVKEEDDSALIKARRLTVPILMEIRRSQGVQWVVPDTVRVAKTENNGAGSRRFEPSEVEAVFRCFNTEKA